MTGTVAYALTKQLIAGVTAGIASWTVDDVEKTITAVTTSGQTLVLHFRQPTDGISIVNVEVDTSDNHLIITYSDGTVEKTENAIPTVEGYAPTVNVYRNTEEQYVLEITTKESHYLTPNLKGHDGEDGKSFTIKAQYPTYESLIAAHPTGEAGDAYFVGEDSNPDLYVWLLDDNEWYNAGKIAGIKGDPGRGIISFEVTNDGRLLVNMDDGTVEDVGTIAVIGYEVVEELPTEGISQTTIYLIKTSVDEEGRNLYDEFIYVKVGENEETGEPVYKWEQLGTHELDVTAKLKNDMTATKAVGGVSVGKTWAKDTELETILRDIISPVLYPTLTNPSASLSRSPSTTLLETGSTLAVTFTVNLNRGSISPAYGTSGYRSGTANGYSLNGGEKQDSSRFSVTVSESNKSFYGTVYYDEGEQPKDSAGQNYNSPLPAGSVNSATANYEFVNAIWSNASDITNIAKEALVSKSTGSKTFVFPAQTVTNVETFDIPASWNVTAVEVLNTLSGKYEDCSGEFTVSDTTHNDAGGNSINYKRYSDNRGYSADSRTIRVSWS